MLYDIPKYLYKYVSMDTLLTILTTQTIKFSAPEEFNDPFEGVIFERPIYQNGIATKFVEDYFFHAKDIFISPKDDNNDVDDDFGVRSKVYHIVKQLARRGAFCLSETHTNILMWSHYANCHKGACIKFRTTKLESQFPDIKRVLYASGMNHLDVFQNADFVLNNAMMYKAIDWHYEKEVRIFNNPGIYKFDPEAIDTIYLGVNFFEKQVHLNFNKALTSNQQYKDVDVITGQINTNSFKIDFLGHQRITGFNDHLPLIRRAD